MSPIKRLSIKEKRDEGNKLRVERHKLTMQPSLPKKKKKRDEWPCLFRFVDLGPHSYQWANPHFPGVVAVFSFPTSPPLINFHYMRDNLRVIFGISHLFLQF